MSNFPSERTANMVHFPQKVATDPHALDEYLDGIDANIDAIVSGAQELWLPASVWLNNSGVPPYSIDPTMVVPVFTFDPTTNEFVWHTWAPPKRWNRGTIQFQVYWSLEGSGTNAVVWSLEAGSYSNGDSINNTFNTVSVTDNGTGADGDLQISPVSAALTVAGSPAVGDLIKLTFLRNATDAADTATNDAHMFGVKIFWTANAGSDT